LTRVEIYKNDLIVSMSEVSVFNTKDIENIISWFERLYNSDEEISDYERETYLKLAKYFILEEKAMS
jgi:hypothetical protein